MAASPVVSPWRRYGKNRLYVSMPDGTKLGYWDLDTDTAHLASPADLTALTAAVAAWQPDMTPVPAVEGKPSLNEHEPVVVEALPEPEPEPEPVEASWYDLAANKPGQAVREQALAAKAEAPVYSLLNRMFDFDKQDPERAWRVGADGEERVGLVLDRLLRKDPRWRVLHSIPVGKADSDIDHVLIGPAGVFTVNTKHHPGARVWVAGASLQVNRNSQPYIRNSKHEAQRAGRLLTTNCGFPVKVVGLIVLVGVEKLSRGLKELPENIHVMQRGDLYGWLRKQPEVLTTAGVDVIYEQARRSTTWHA